MYSNQLCFDYLVLNAFFEIPEPNSLRDRIEMPNPDANVWRTREANLPLLVSRSSTFPVWQCACLW